MCHQLGDNSSLSPKDKFEAGKRKSDGVACRETERRRGKVSGESFEESSRESAQGDEINLIKVKVRALWRRDRKKEGRGRRREEGRERERTREKALDAGS